MKDSDHRHQIWRTLDVFKDCPKCLFVDGIKSFSQVKEYWVEGLVLFNALLLKLSHSEYHVYSAPARPVAALCLREGLFGDCDESVKDDSREDLSCNWEEGNAPVVPAVRLTSLFLIEGEDQGVAEVVWHHLLLPDSEQDIVEGPKGIGARSLVDLSRDAILSRCSISQCCLRWSHDPGASRLALAGIVPGRMGPSAWWHCRRPWQSWVGFRGAVQCAASVQPWPVCGQSSTQRLSWHGSHGRPWCLVEVYQISVFRPRVHPSGLVLVYHPEQGVDDADAVLCTLAEEEQAVVLDLTYLVSAQNAFPAAVVPSHPRIKVSKDDKFVARWGWPDDLVKLFIKLFLGIIWACKCRGVSADNCEVSDPAERDVQFHEAFVDSNW